MIDRGQDASCIPGERDVDIDDRVLPTILERQAERFGNRQFLEICGRSATFEDIHILSNRLANGFRSLGVKQSDRVAMILPNCFEFVTVWFAVAKLGAIEVPNNPGLKGDFLCHNLNNCGAKILVASGMALQEIAKVQSRLPNVDTLVLVDVDPHAARAAGIRIKRILAFEQCLAQDVNIDPVDIHYSHPMAILYTSGTTGPAKGVLMSHHHCYMWAKAMARNLGYTSEDIYFSALPLFHTDAQMFGVYMPLVYGTRATLVDGFSATKFWDQVRASCATATNLLGAMAVILTRAAASESDACNPVRVAQCIPMVPDKESFEQRFDMKLVTGYGQTETSFVTLDAVDQSRVTSCGRINPDWEVAIVDESDRFVPAGTIGEIVTRPKRSWSMFSGYYGAEDKTVRTLRNLWYHSGDAGYLDEDGWLYFKHRLDDTIRRRGENISTFELESILQQHPEIVEGVAFGMPSEFTEEDIMIVAVRKSGSTVEPAALVEHFIQYGPRHMVPRYVEVIESPLPRTPTEKVARSILRQKGIGEATYDRGPR